MRLGIVNPVGTDGRPPADIDWSENREGGRKRERERLCVSVSVCVCSQTQENECERDSVQVMD